MCSFDELALVLPDGYRAYGRYWPGNEIRGAVLYHHGIQSHCGWFEQSARCLARAGYAVLQVDRRGCGRNEVDRGHAESAEQLIDDALAARDELRRRSGFDAYHVIGVSWGGKLAVAAYVTDPSGVASLSLVTPGLFPRVGVSKEEAATIGFAMLYEPRRLFDIPLNRADLFTTNARGRSFFEEDPLTLQQCTAGFFLASRRMDKLIDRLPEAEPVPVLLCLAGIEEVIQNGRTIEFVRKLDWPATTIMVYDGARHSLEFENVAEAFFVDLTSFIEGVSARGAGAVGKRDDVQW